jgi:uncharacterized membrane protein YozB (DUF420 family)
MILVTDLPAINATLNATAAALLLTGLYFIKQRNRKAHERAMLAALGVSALFLACYLVYHYNVGSVKYQKQDWTRPLYFAILISHTVLAAAVPVLALVTLRRAWRGDFARHRRIAKVTLPVWLYVSVTGVIVYWMLYRL